MQTHNTYHFDMAGAIVLLIHPMLPMAPQVAGTDLERKRHCQEALLVIFSNSKVFPIIRISTISAGMGFFSSHAGLQQSLPSPPDNV